MALESGKTDPLGAMPMDRPEDVEANPATGRVYVVCTYNEQRKPEHINAANPRAENKWGQIVEIVPPAVKGEGYDHAATTCRWGFFIVAGNPKDPKAQAQYHPATSEDGWFQAPDNITFDLWCGPAPLVPPRRLRLHYDWHWVFETGSGDHNFTLTMTGTNAYTDEDQGNTIEGTYTRTKNGTDDYSITVTGIKTGGSYEVLFAICASSYLLALAVVHILSPRLAPAAV